MKLLVCVGSSCHLKGSYEVIQKLQEVIMKYNVIDEIDLQASFCLGHCATGVTAKADDVFLHNLNVDNVEDVFIEQVYPLLKK